LWIDEVEVVGTGDEEQGDGVALAAGLFGPALGQGGRDLIVIGALDEELGEVEGEEVAGVGGEVALGLLVGRSAHEGVDLVAVVGEGEVAGEVDGELEVDGAGEADDGLERDAGLGIVDGAAGEDVMAASEPEGQVAAGGVAGCDDATEVDG